LTPADSILSQQLRRSRERAGPRCSRTRRNYVQPLKIQTDPAPAPPRRDRRKGDLLASFGLSSIFVLVAALGITSLLLVRAFRARTAAELDASAPALMGLIRDAVAQHAGDPPERLARELHDLTRLSQVQFCRWVPLGPDGRPAPNAAITASADGAAPLDAAAQLVLRTAIRTDDTAGTIEVGFVPGRAGLAALEGVAWTAAGLMTVAAVGAFGLMHRMLQRRLRPISFVRDNLLAYHDGLEKSLELLALQDAVGREGAAWNTLIASVRELQQELDRARSQQALVGSKQLVQNRSSRAILDALPTGILRIDADERVQYANYSAERLLNLGPVEGPAPALEERVGRALAETIRGLRRKGAGAWTDQRIEDGAAHSIVRLTLIPVRESGADEVVLLLQDVSQLKEAERAREEFLAHITHELRTPLTNIRAYTETLTEDFFDDEKTRRECYNVIMSETRRLSKLIEDVLSASQMDAGVARLERTVIRVDQSLRKAVQELAASAEAKGVELSLHIPSKVPPVLGDRLRLHQVWINLVGNAIKYTPAGGSVTVDVQPDEQRLLVCVTDTGIGIAPEFLDRVFDKFFRVPDPAVSAEEGSGLGLSITREIVRLHGGAIRVESVAGSGSTFIVELPLARDAEPPAVPEAADGANRNR
jgi:two-component system phosphate regulon sensor histidine kinase PhoR